MKNHRDEEEEEKQFSEKYISEHRVNEKEFVPSKKYDDDALCSSF